MNEQQPSHTSTLIIMRILMLGRLASMFLTSCASTRQDGCYDTRHLVGYK
jgi:hypothetical protein